MESESARSEMMLSVKPIAPISMNAAMTDTGSASAVMTVAFPSFRKSMTITTVRMAPITSSNSVSSTECSDGRPSCRG